MRAIATASVVAFVLSICALSALRTSAQTEALWSDCRVETLSGSVRRLHCPAFRLSLSRATVISSPGWLDTIVAQMGSGASATAEQLDVGGRAIPVRVVEQSSRLSIVGSPRAETLAVCEVASREELGRCREALSWIAQHGLPPGVSFPEPRLELLGRTLRVPPGCQLVGAERISCPGGVALDWRAGIAREPRAVLDLYATQIRGRFPSASVDDVECVVAGRGGTGRRIAMGPISTILCAVDEGTTTSIAQCIGALPPGSPWAEPCSQVFEGAVP